MPPLYVMGLLLLLFAHQSYAARGSPHFYQLMSVFRDSCELVTQTARLSNSTIFHAQQRHITLAVVRQANFLSDDLQLPLSCADVAGVCCQHVVLLG